MILSPTKPRPLRWLLLALTALCVFGLALLLSRGTAGGDESLPVQDAVLLWAGGGTAIFHSSEMFLLAHRFFWFLEKCVWRGLLLLVMPRGLRQNAMAQDALMAMDSVLFMFGALFAMAHHLRRRGYSGPVASLTAGTLLFASSAISFFSGGVLECQMIFFAVVIAAALDDARTSIRWAALLLASFSLILCKGYALLVLLPLTLLLPRRRDQLIYFTFIGIMAALSAAILRLIGGDNGVASFYETLLGSPSVGATIMHFGEFFVSFPFGIVWCFPLLGFVFFAGEGVRRALMLKLAGIILLAIFLSLFAFWHGGGAVAGPRYTVPFLMLLFPEVAAGLDALLRRRRWAGFAVPVLALLFLPSLDYHNGLIYRWSSQPNDYSQWGEADPLMQPGILAWRVVLAKERGAENFRPSTGMALTSPTWAVFPMTSISRLSYVLAVPGPDPKEMSARAWLQNHDLAHPLILALLRSLLAAALLLWLFFAAATAARQPGQAKLAS